MSGNASIFTSIGYKWFLTDIGFDFAYGSLYICPVFKLPNDMFISIPTNLFGGPRFIAYLIDSDNYSVFQIGIGIGYRI